MKESTNNVFEDVLNTSRKIKVYAPSPKLYFIATEIYGLQIDGLDVDGILKRIRQAEIRHNRRR